MGGPLFHVADLLRLAGHLLPAICTDELAVSAGVPASVRTSILKLTYVSVCLLGSRVGKEPAWPAPGLQPAAGGRSSCCMNLPVDMHHADTPLGSPPTAPQTLPTRLQGPSRCLVVMAAVSALVQWACAQKARAAGSPVTDGSTPFARACSDLCDALCCPEAAAIARSGSRPTLEQIGEVQSWLTAVTVVPALSNAVLRQQQPEPPAALRVRVAQALAIRRCANLRCPDPAGGAAAKKCSGCRLLRYCCTDCQRTDWQEGGHRQTCPLLREGSS